MFKKHFFVLLVIFLVLSSLVGCSNNADAEATPTPAADIATPDPNAGKGIIGLSLSSETPFNLVFQEYFEQSFKDSDYVVKTLYANGDYNQQVADLADLLAEGAELLVLDPSDLDNLEYILSEYEVSEVPVINLTESVNAYTKMLIGPFYREMGKEIGEFTFEKLADATDYKYKTNTVMLRGSVDSSKMQSIYDGFLEAVEDSRYNTLVAAPACNYDFDTTKAEMAALLKEYGKIHCVFAETSEMAIAAIEAIDEAGVTGVIITTIGGDPDILSYVESGRVDGTIIYGPNDMASITANYARRLLEDKLDLLPQFVELNYEIIKPSNVSNYYSDETIYALTSKSTELPADPTPTPDSDEDEDTDEDEE